MKRNYEPRTLNLNYEPVESTKVNKVFAGKKNQNKFTQNSNQFKKNSNYNSCHMNQ